MMKSEAKSGMSIKSEFKMNKVLQKNTQMGTGVFHKPDEGFKLKSLDLLGEPVLFKWNGNEVFKTKVGIFWSMMAYGMIGLVFYVYIMHFITCDEPNVTTSPSYEIPTESAPIELGDEILPTFLMARLTGTVYTPLP